MIITQTPFRISFLGGGTDYPAHYREHGGATLAVSINQYTLVTVHKLTRFVDHCVRVHYSQIESVANIDEIQHPSARECLRFLGINEGIEIHYVSDLPARTGLGSSSSATVGLLHALHAFKGEQVSREQLAQEAVHVEQVMIGERVGSQDQYSCGLGGLRLFEFQQDDVVRSSPVILGQGDLEKFEGHLMLFYTGIQRLAHQVLDEQIERTSSGDNLESLRVMEELAREGVQVLSRKDLVGFGELLHQGWELKRGLSSKISSSWIDELYSRARAAGAVGGKLLGAGGGGFLLLLVEPEKQAAVRFALSDVREANFNFEHNGSQVIFYRPR